MRKKFVLVAKPKSNVERIDKNKSAVIRLDLESLSHETSDGGLKDKSKRKTHKER